MEDENKIENRKIQKNYFIIALILGIFVISIIGKIIETTFVEGKYWKDLAKKHNPKPVRLSIPAIRGNIYSSDGALLSASLPYYQLYMDFWADGFNDSILNSKVKSLSKEMNKLIPEKSAGQYEADILNGLKIKQNEFARIKNGEEKVLKKSREYKLSIRNVDDLELMAIKKMPFFNLGRYKSGLYEKKFEKRIKPFGRLASRTIGDIWDGIKGVGGKNGLELGYDSLLRGEPGFVTLKWVEGKFKQDPDIDPVNGKDIISTININFQSITEEALMDKLNQLNAESGTAVVMEVSTGEIKAITNLKRQSGIWNETLNFALSDMNEPGSIFKIPSMMVALEDGLVHPDDPVDVGKGKYEYAGSKLIDHNYNKGGYGKINAAKSIWFSSNIGVAKLILKGYEKNPGKFIDGLHKLGFNKDLNLEIPGYGVAKVLHPKEFPKAWSKTTLPWASFGYGVQVTPIQMLCFYNAIANDGKMVKPLFVKEIRDDRKIEKKNTEVLIEKICSENTLKYIHQMLDSVVNHPFGTGKPVKSDIVRIAGKTGTAQLSQGLAGYKLGTISHLVSFVGYFPADSPIYSCIVVIRRPLVGNPSGGAMSGAVFKQIAEAISKLESKTEIVLLAKEKTKAAIPTVKAGQSDDSKFVLNKLNIRFEDNIKGKWISPQWNNNKLIFEERQIAGTNNTVPNVIGMGAKDAVYALENTGIKVNLSGRGQVYSQSLIAGTTVTKGQTITIQLR